MLSGSEEVPRSAVLQTMESLSKQENNAACFVQQKETDKAHLILMHEPTTEVFLSSLHPEGNLFERPLSHREAQQHHRSLVGMFTALGIRVIKVRDVLSQTSETNPLFRKKMEGLALRQLSYSYEGDVTRLPLPKQYLLSDTYKQEVISHMTSQELVDVILTRPTVTLTDSERNTLLRTEPLGNLVFTRDQQIVTSKGVVLARLSALQRQAESAVMKYCFEALNIPIIAEIPEPCTLEGGDFFPVSKDLCMLGIGLRTNMAAAEYLMSKDVLGTRRVALVCDETDLSQERMHLDTIFNIVDDYTVMLLETVCGELSHLRRIVREYIRQSDGSYREERSLEFYRWLIEERYTVIPVTKEQQQHYMLNFVHTGRDDGTLVSVHPGLKHLLRSYQKRNPVQYVDYRNVTSMYGAAHCSTQIFRTPSYPPGEEQVHHHLSAQAPPYEPNETTDSAEPESEPGPETLAGIPNSAGTPNDESHVPIPPPRRHRLSEISSIPQETQENSRLDALHPTNEHKQAAELSRPRDSLRDVVETKDSLNKHVERHTGVRQITGGVRTPRRFSNDFVAGQRQFR